MPVIPQYQRKIGEAEAPAVRSPMNHSADEFGAPVAKAMGQLGAVAEDISVKMDRAAVVQAENYLRTKTTEALYGENGILKRKGAAAANADKDFDKNYDSILAETRKGLSGRAARSFELLAGQYKSQLFPTIQGHIAKQAEVAQDEALAGQEYADTMEMANKWRDRNAVAVMLTKGEAAVRARYAGHDPAFVAAKVQLRNSNVLRARAEALYKEGQADDLREYLGLYEKHMDPNAVAGLKGWIKQKDENAAISREAERIVAAAGGDYAKAIELVRNGKPVSAGWNGIRSAAEKQLGKPYQLGADGKNKTDCGQYTLEVFRENGIDLKSRDVSEQARMLNEKGGFTTDSANLKPGDLVFYKNTYQPPEGHGFNNITHAAIYAGNGKIIHAGSSKGVTYASIDDPGEIAGYGTPGGSGIADPVYREKLESKVIALMNREKAIKASQDHQEMVRVENELALADGDEVKQQEIVNSSSLEPRHKKNLLKQIADAGKLKESDASAYRELLTLKIDGKLTPEKVSEYGQLLTRKDYFSFLGESLEIAKKTQVTAEKEADNLADKAWKTAVEGLGRQRYEKDQLIQSIAYTIDNEKLKGDARRVRALELVKQDRENKGAIFKRVSQDQDKWSFLTDAWGAGSIDGLKKAGLTPDVAEQFLMSIDRNDYLQNEALRLLIAGGKPINKENLNTVMFRLASTEHPFKPFEMK